MGGVVERPAFWLLLIVVLVVAVVVLVVALVRSRRRARAPIVPKGAEQQEAAGP